MKHLSLAAKYRPQKFSEVIGQNLASTALARAVTMNRIAPAYLFSGTRGVGKTTIARIFARALNCEQGQGGEPCNECSSCRHILAGNHVDVNEIDGASNTGVEDVRALRESIGFMPMEGKYRIFIVDEAHMLSKSAFNAMLKTLEEPPPHTVFIFATTEAHRFPATIISRCQHYVFRHLPDDAIYGHLARILSSEGVSFEPGAVRIIARRSAGSARDSLSLLDQAMAVTQGSLTEEAAREALGLAGQEFFDNLFAAISGRDCNAAVALCRELLRTGADIGFFLRELSSNLRNLFLFRQAGENILPTLAVSPDEEAFIRKHAQSFRPAHLHAAWQMALDSQRNIARSPEPGSGLELLLINMTLLPELVPVAAVSGDSGLSEQVPASGKPPAPQKPGYRARMESPIATAKKMEETPAPFPPVSHSENWPCFLGFCQDERDKGEEALPMDILSLLKVDWTERKLVIAVPNQTLWARVEKKRELLLAALKKYCGKLPEVEFIPPPTQAQPVSEDAFKQCAQLPEIALCKEILGAVLTECYPVDAPH